MHNSKQNLIGFLLILFVLPIGWQFRPEAVQAKPATQPPSITISDNNFNLNDWQVVEERVTGGGSYQVEQGNGFRRIWHYQPPVTDVGSVALFHFYQGQIYNPAVSGPIDSIDYVEVGRLNNNPYPNALIRGQFAILQNGNYYVTDSFEIRFDNAKWQTINLSNLTANNFSNSGSGEGGGSQHPDFSAQGAPLTFGFLRFSSRGIFSPLPGNETLVYEHDLDYWQVTLNRTTAGPQNQPPVAEDDTYVIDASFGRIIEILSPLENDYDPNGDSITLVPLNLTTQYGQVMDVGQNIMYTRYGPGGRPENFNYTVTDGLLTDRATVFIYLDCGCLISCYLDNINRAGQNSTLDLKLIYRLRDQVMKPTVNGNRYVEMYYQTTPEIVKLLMVDQPALGDEAVAVAELWQDNLYNLVDGDGSAVVTQVQVEAIKTFLANLRAAGSSDLQQVIDTELARLGPLDDFVGLTVIEAKTKAIGPATAQVESTVYLPLILK